MLTGQQRNKETFTACFLKPGNYREIFSGRWQVAGEENSATSSFLTWDGMELWKERNTL